MPKKNKYFPWSCGVKEHVGACSFTWMLCCIAETMLFVFVTGVVPIGLLCCIGLLITGLNLGKAQQFQTWSMYLSLGRFSFSQHVLQPM